ncbi:MAG: type III-A CRISPR-associated RAMP protein Csm5 [Oscillospiraceae bacterium]|nr:type III-A CRISPR-associated RAMP protein Csm5 [Oscillospiraceae bacterium]
MNNFLRRFTLTLTVESPIHIGSGETLNQKEYIFDKRNRLVYFPEMHNMFRMLKNKGLIERYEQFMFDKQNDLSYFLLNNNVSYEAWWGEPISVSNTVTKLSNISSHIKDIYGLPYIPGSSIKGAFRTVLLSQEMRNRRVNGNPVLHNLNNINGEAAKRLEADILNVLDRNEKNKRDAVNDVMAAFRFSDSEPIDRSFITLCQKKDMPVSTKNADEKSLNVFRECIKPGTKIHIMLAVDTALLNGTPYADLFNKKSYKISNEQTVKMLVINAMLRNYNVAYTNEYRKYFPEIERYNPNVLYIGAGTGFVSKTMLLGLLNEEDRLIYTTNLLSERHRNHKHREDIELGVSPHILKLTEYEGDLYEMGRCILDIKEV